MRLIKRTTKVFLLVMIWTMLITASSFAGLDDPRITNPDDGDVYKEGDGVRFEWTNVEDEYVYSLFDETEDKFLYKNRQTKKDHVSVSSSKFEADHRYSFTVASVDGNKRSDHDEITFSFEEGELITPEIKNLEDGDRFEEGEDLKVKWENTGENYKYSLYDHDEDEYVYKDKRTNETSVEISESKFEVGHRYEFSIYAYRSGEQSDENSADFEIVNYTPDEVDITTPDYGEEIIEGNDIRVAWSSGEREFFYELEDKSDGNIIDHGTLEKNTMEFDEELFSPGSYYELRIWAINEDKRSDYSKVKFYIQYEGAVPTEIERPSDGKTYKIDKDVTIEFKDTEDKYIYSLYDDTFGDYVIKEEQTSDTEITISHSKLDYGHSYTFEVFTKSGSDSSLKRNVTFNVEEKEVKGTKITYPKDLKVIETPLVIEYKDVSDWYEFELIDLTNDDELVLSDKTSLSEIDVPKDKLKRGHWYQIRIWAVDGQYVSETDSISFKVDGDSGLETKITFPLPGARVEKTRDLEFLFRPVSQKHIYSLYDHTDDKYIVEEKTTSKNRLELGKKLTAGHKYTFSVAPFREDQAPVYKLVEFIAVAESVDNLDEVILEEIMDRYKVVADSIERLDWSQDVKPYLNYLVEEGVIMSESLSDLNLPVNREEFAVLVYSVFEDEGQKSKIKEFSDTLNSEFSEQFSSVARHLETFTDSEGNVQFKPDLPLYRFQYLEAIGKMFDLKSNELSGAWKEYLSERQIAQLNEYVIGALEWGVIEPDESNNSLYVPMTKGEFLKSLAKLVVQYKLGYILY